MTSERTTMPRQWALLKALPPYPRKASIRELWRKMEDLGYEVTKRTIERDLVILSRQFRIVSDEAKPAGWSVMSDEKTVSKTAELLLREINPPIQRSTASSPVNKIEPIADETLEELTDVLTPRNFAGMQSLHPNLFVGRDWLLNRVDQWLANRNSPLLWLYGSPGVGKTAFASWLTQHRPNQIIGAFFCQFQYQKSADEIARDAIRFFAFHLARHFPAYRHKLVEQNAFDKTQLQNQTADDLFYGLILRPLIDAGNPPSFNPANGRYALIVDGLDEAAQDPSANVLIDILFKYAKDIPHYLGVLITSRPDAELRCRLAGFESFEIAADAKENQNDLHLWLERKIPKQLTDEQRQALINQLLQKSEGLFLYLKLLEQEETDCWSNSESIPKGLDGYFTAYFARYFSNIALYSEHQRPFLEILVSALEPISLATVCALLGWDEYRCNSIIASFGALFSENAVTDRNNLQTDAYLDFDDDRGQPRKLIPFHKALMDWLTDRNRAGKYLVSQSQGNKRLAEALWETYERNIENLTEYGFCHLPRHLTLAGRQSDACACLLNFEFILERADIPAINSDIDRVMAEYRQTSINAPVDHALEQWALFFRANSHYLQKGHSEWPASHILLQRAIEDVEGSPIRQAAEDYVEHKHQGYWLRSMTPQITPACRVLATDCDGLVPPLLTDNCIVVAALNGAIRVLHSHTGQPLVILHGHRGPLTGLMMLDSNRVLSWSDHDESLRLWDIETGECLSILIEGKGKIQCVRLLTNQQFIVSCENQYRIWDYAGQERFAIEKLGNVKNRYFQESIWPLANGNFLIGRKTYHDGELANSSQLTLWSGKTGSLVATLKSLDIFKDEIERANLDKELPDTSEVRKAGEALHEKIKSFEISTLEVEQLPGGEILTWSHGSKDFQLWNSESGQLLATAAKKENAPIRLLRGLPIRIMTVNDDAEGLPRKIRTWVWNGNVLKVENEFDLTPEPDRTSNDLASIFDPSLFEDGQVLIPCPLTLCDGLTGEVIAKLNGWQPDITWDEFFWRFYDGRVLTLSKQPWAGSKANIGFYLWNSRGKLISETQVESRFFDIRILNEDYFVTLNYDDSVSLWDADTGILLKVFRTSGGRIRNIEILNNGQLLMLNATNTLSLWPMQTMTSDIVENMHASRSEIHTHLFKNTILSYSRDSFPPRLWNANTGELIAVLPGYTKGLGSHLAGIIPLSGERFLTWGNERTLNIYDSEQGYCVSTLENSIPSRTGRSQVWPLQNDRILCRFWDGSLRLWNLEKSNFDSYHIVAHKVAGAQPLGDDRIFYWNEDGVLGIWNIPESRHEYDFVGPFKGIESVKALSGLRLIITDNDMGDYRIDTPSIRSFHFLDWMSGRYLPLTVSINEPKKILEISDGRLILWSDDFAEIWNIGETAAPRFQINFENHDKLKFITQLPNGNLLTQAENNRATLWNVWDGNTGELIDSVIMPNEQGLCLEAQSLGQTVMLHMQCTPRDTDFPSLVDPMSTDYYCLLDWQHADGLQFKTLNDIEPKDFTLELKKLLQPLLLNKGNWLYWNNLTGSPVGISRMGGKKVHCEWHGDTLTQFITLTESGRIIGFGRKPIILQLYLGNRAVGFN